MEKKFEITAAFLKDLHSANRMSDVKKALEKHYADVFVPQWEQNREHYGVSPCFKVDGDYDLFRKMPMNLSINKMSTIALNFGPDSDNKGKQDSFFAVWVHPETARNIYKALKKAGFDRD